MKKFIILLSILISSQVSFSQKAIFVSPNGNDANSGIETLPLKTLSAALTLSRNNNIKTIILRAGKYYGVSVNLIPDDSGLIIKNYPNEEPILYGGVIITKLYKENNFICADLPENKAGWDFRMILVNDSLRERSRLPEKGYFNHLSTWSVKRVTGGWAQKPTQEELTSLKYDPKDVNSWIKNYSNAELTVLHSWDDSYLGIRSVDIVQHIVHFTFPATEAPGAFGNKKYIVWNTMQGLSHAGQWYWDKKLNKIYYLALKDEDINNIELIVPTSRNVIAFSKGTKAITLEGLTIKASGNLLQNEDSRARNIDAAITGIGVSHIIINKLSILRTGGNGIKLSGENITISESKFNAIGGGGIYYSGKNIKIKNCSILNTGLIFYGAVGIQGDGGIRDSIVNCNIINTTYSGISMWGDSCLIEKCSIKHSMTILQDGAAIYCTAHPNITVRNNYIIGNNDTHYTMGIYFDEKCNNCLAENNIVINSGIPVQCNNVTNILYKNNLFFDANPQHINYGASSAIALNNNLFIAPSILYYGPTNHDAKVDTLTLDPKIRKYANPTGVTSFKNNLILTTGDPNRKVAPKLPIIDQNLLSGTLVKTVDKSETNDFKALINSQLVKKYIDIKKLNLNDNQINEIVKETR